MENRILNDKNISVGRLIVTLLMLMLVVVGGTFAWLTYSSKQSALVLTIGDINDTQIKLSPYQVTGNITPGTTHTSGVYSEVEVTKGNNNSTSFALFYKINQLDTTLIDKGLSYTIVNTKGTTSTSDDVTVKTGKFSSLIDTSKPLPEEVVILDTNTDSTLSANTSTYYRVYLWVDSSVGNQTDIQNSTLNVELNGSIGSVAINGYSVYGHTLTTTVNDAVVDNDTTYSYQWYSNSTNTTKGGTAISGATASSYTVGSGYVGKYIYVVVTTSGGKTLSDVTDSSNNYTIDQECDNFNDGRVEKTTPVLALSSSSGTVEAGSDNTFTTTVNKSTNYVSITDYTGTLTADSVDTDNVEILSVVPSLMTIGVSSSGSSTIKYHAKDSNEAKSNIKVTFTPDDTNNVCTVSKNYSVDKQDTKVPTGLSITTTDDLNSATQTATLRCSDIVGVTGYYFGTTKPTASSTFKTITSTKSMSVTETVSAAGTYYLACKDAAGNTSVSTEVKQVYYSYSVNQMLVNVTGTEGTYTTAHYTKYATIPSSGKYIVPSGTTMVRDTIKGSAPTGSSTSLYKGLSGSAASSSAATLLTSDPKISANTTYSSWWNRTTYTITVATGGNGSNKVSNQRSQSVTASSSGTNQTLSIRYGEQITATATPNTGYTFSGWSGLATGTTNPLTNTPNKNATLTANFTANGYTVTYYNGTSKINTSSHLYDTAKNLTTWATLGATVTNSSSGWEFAGWSTANNSTTRTYTDGQSVNNLTATVNGNVNLYAVYKRTVTFKSGVSAGNTDSTVTQYWNPAGTTNGTHLTSVSSPAVTTINLTTYGWSALGYRNDATAGAKEYDASGTIYPATNGSNTLYGVYSRTVTFKSGVNAGTSDGTRTQYLNASGNTVSSINSYAPSTTNLTDYGWGAIGYRDDTTAGAKEYSSGTSTSIKPAYNTSNTLYAAYSRTVTFKSGVSAGTTDGTRTQYLNASGNAVSNINSYTPTTTNLSTYGWSALGYRDDTTAGDKEYASGTSTAITLAYNTSNTLYGVYSRTVTFKSGVNKATTDGTRTQYLNTSGNAVTNVNSYVPVDVTNWTTLGYRDDTTSGAKEYSTGTSTSLTPVYNVSNTLYAVYSRSYTATFYSGVAKATTKTVTSSTVYYNSNTTSLPTTVSITTETPADVSGFSKLGWRDDTTAGAKEHSSATAVTVAWGTNFYAVYSRTITAYSGVSKATNSSLTQYYNSNGAITSVTLPTPTAISNWTTLGYRDDTTAGDKEYASTYTYTPAVGTTPVTFYASYSRTNTATFYSGVSKATTKTVTGTAYYNSNVSSTPTTVSITAPAASNNTDISNWTELGYRDDTTVSSQEVSFGGSLTLTLGTTYTYYAVYSRTLTIAYNGNGNTGGSTSNTTKTIYLSSNSTTTSSQEVTLAANGFSKTGYTFSKWAAGSTSGTQYSASAKYTPGVAYNAGTFGITMYAIWTANTYTVTLNNQGATTAGSTSVTATYDSAMPSITVPSKTGYTFGGYFSTTTARDLTSSIEKYASIIRVSVVGTSNGWKMTSDDKGSHVQAVITITDSSLSSAPRPEFNDVGLTNGTQYRVTGGSGTWTYYFDFDVTETMVSYRQYRYDTTHRFIDFEDTSSNTSTTVNMFVAFGKKYYNSNGTSAWNYDIASNTTLYAKWTTNAVTIYYNVNGGTVTSSTTSTSGNTYTWTTESDGTVLRNGVAHNTTINYGGSTSDSGLANYDNPESLEIKKTGYTGKEDEEWICLSGCTTANKTFNDTVVYSASDFCDASASSCTVEVGVNWVDVTAPSISVSLKYAGTSTTYSGSWTNSNVTATVTFSDSGSGINKSKLQWTCDGTWSTISSNTSTSSYTHTWSSDRNSSTCKYRIYDKAGNYKDTSNFTIKIDKTAPTGTFSASNSGTTINASWTNVSATISGVYRYYYAVVASSASCDSASYTASTNANYSNDNYTSGSWKVCSYIKDNANNSSAVSSANVTLSVTLAQYITNLYNAGSKGTVTNNGKTYTRDTTNYLINDGFGQGGKSVATDGNLRYYGASPNNYVNFNFETWRIVGVFTVNGERRVKLVKGDTTGTNKKWDDNVFAMDWGATGHTLYKYLTETYYPTIDESARNIIANSSFNVGSTTGTTLVNYYSDDYYEMEIATTKNENIALLNASDYGYMYNFTNCTKKLRSASTTACYQNNWFIKQMNIENEKYGYAWLLNRYPSGNGAHAIVGGSSSYGYISYAESKAVKAFIYPVVYLKENVYAASGEGTKSSPYTLALS